VALESPHICPRWNRLLKATYWNECLSVQFFPFPEGTPSRPIRFDGQGILIGAGQGGMKAAGFEYVLINPSMQGLLTKDRKD
jgi:hypothetical protein